MIYVRADDQDNPVFSDFRNKIARIHVPSNEDSPIIYKGDAVQVANDFVRLVDDMKEHGYDKIAAMVMLDRIHELLPIEDK